MTSKEVRTLSDADICSRVEDVVIFAHTMPEQKLRIVSALKAADIGIAMASMGRMWRGRRRHRACGA